MLTERVYPLLIYQMVKRAAPDLERLFHALADATRRRILSQVAIDPGRRTAWQRSKLVRVLSCRPSGLCLR
jgi:DNA-binding transcriptional ArsR family regulator